MKSFIAALQFLTILPFLNRIKTDESDLAQSKNYFLIVGMIIGLILWIIDILLKKYLPLELVSWLEIIFLGLISGALHLDGLADTADAFLSAKKQEQKLQIMHDSRSGPMAIITLFFVIYLKYLSIKHLPLDYRGLILFLLPIYGRLSILIQLHFLRYARKNGGIATIFIKKYQTWPVYLHFLLLIFSSYLLLGKLLLLPLIVFLLINGLFILYTKKQLGGFTGDTLGAFCELVEMFWPLCFCCPT